MSAKMQAQIIRLQDRLAAIEAESTGEDYKHENMYQDEIKQISERLSQIEQRLVVLETKPKRGRPPKK